jgi:hypothetical protein
MRSIRRLTHTACWLAALAYASGFKRAGRNYLAVAIVVQAQRTAAAHVVMSGPLPSCRGLTTSYVH